MALERESKYVSIGNMPYVAPQTGNALSGVTEAIGDEIQKRQTEEDNLELAEVNASMWSAATFLFEQQKSNENGPDPQVFNKEIGKSLTTIANTGSNRTVRNKANISAQSISSQFSNNALRYFYQFQGQKAIADNEAFLQNTVNGLGKSENKREMLPAALEQVNLNRTGALARTNNQMTQSQIDKQYDSVVKELKLMAVREQYNEELITKGSVIANQNLFKNVNDVTNSQKTATFVDAIKRNVPVELRDDIKQKLTKSFLDVFAEPDYTKKLTMLDEIDKTSGPDATAKIRNALLTDLANMNDKEFTAVVNGNFATANSVAELEQRQMNMLLMAQGDTAKTSKINVAAIKRSAEIEVENIQVRTNRAKAEETNRVKNVSTRYGASIERGLKNGSIPLDTNITVFENSLLQTIPGALPFANVNSLNNKELPNNIVSNIENVRGTLLAQQDTWTAFGNSPRRTPTPAERTAGNAVFIMGGGEKEYSNWLNEQDPEVKLQMANTLADKLVGMKLVPDVVTKGFENVGSGTAENAFAQFELFSLIDQMQKDNNIEITNISDDAYTLLGIIKDRYGSDRSNGMTSEDQIKDMQRILDRLDENKTGKLQGFENTLAPYASILENQINPETKKLYINEALSKALQSRVNDSSLAFGALEALSSVPIFDNDPLFKIANSDTPLGKQFTTGQFGRTSGVVNNITGFLNNVLDAVMGTSDDFNLAPTIREDFKRFVKQKALTSNGAFSSEDLARTYIENNITKKLHSDPSYHSRGMLFDSINPVSLESPMSTHGLTVKQSATSLLEKAGLFEKRAIAFNSGKGFQASLNEPKAAVPGKFVAQSGIAEDMRNLKPPIEARRPAFIMKAINEIGEVIRKSESGHIRQDGTLDWPKMWADGKLKWNNPKVVNGATQYKISYIDKNNNFFDIPNESNGFYHSPSIVPYNKRTRASLGN